MNNYKKNKAIVASVINDAQVNELTEQARKLARRVTKMVIKEETGRNSTDINDSQAKKPNKIIETIEDGVEEIFKEYDKKHPIKPEDFANHHKKIADYLLSAAKEFVKELLYNVFLDDIPSGIPECLLKRPRAKKVTKQANKRNKKRKTMNNYKNIEVLELDEMVIEEVII